jgi:hypothetical protein
MATLAALWLPILLSAVLVFIVSSLIHMVLKYHASDYRKLPNEDAVRSTIRTGNPAPGQYVMPHCTDMKEMQSPEMKQKFTEGPVGIITLKKPGPVQMGGSLAQWFVFTLVISYITAYVAYHALQTGVPSRGHVLRLAGIVAWLGYAGAVIPQAIWMGKPWRVAAKEVFDGLLYALVTGAAFAYLWPR